MKRSDFQYHLPRELIAQQPLAERTASRLLRVDSESLTDGQFSDVVDIFQPGDLLVFNDTRVIPARMLGKKTTGGKVEVLVERVLDDKRILAHVRANKSPKPGTRLLLENAVEATMLEREGDLFKLEFIMSASVFDILEQHGHMPLPPYIERADNADDKHRYQTVFADKPGAVAAPTAGLHFDEGILQALQQKGISTAKVTLHVGAGTFQPVKVENLTDHIMHAEYVIVPQATCDAIHACKQRGGNVIAVGTTTVRSLEAASQKSGVPEAFAGDTRLFITPGYTFHAVDKLLTNFHLPGSTLLMLVAAFAGYENIMKAYQHAVAQQYRFFSYGDAMLLNRADSPKTAKQGSVC